ncbi:hypothetical protein GPAL_0294 [Glaciecola pallidula DSM 14239 = ACAM 615]|uniref:Uncharacterized protein n=1 Tax=Brumicola pallidula DSM 14239 = ACAM 615 TaxID=1121922 RepID=K6ZV14_9ALTE|nr:hypothetical protein GPAL_0294 [Glaciecola pallidula DSM 14239 = ACAM 615]
MYWLSRKGLSTNVEFPLAKKCFFSMLAANNCRPYNQKQ